MAQSREYKAWSHMMENRGQTVPVEPFLCDFKNFVSFMGARPEGMSLHLIDRLIGYKRGNVAWGPSRKQKPPSCKVGNRKREHNSWKNMLVRTYYPSHERHKKYAEIGCYVEEYLQDFENFYTFMGPRPEGMTLDRSDPFGPYIRSNIRWATVAEQNRNTKRNAKPKQLSFPGELLEEQKGEAA